MLVLCMWSASGGDSENGHCNWLTMLLFPLTTEDFLQAKQVYKEALKQAQQKGDVASVQHIQEELAELAKRRKGSK